MSEKESAIAVAFVYTKKDKACNQFNSVVQKDNKDEISLFSERLHARLGIQI
jgi:hypothetical protein